MFCVNINIVNRNKITYKDTQSTLASAMGLSLSRLNAKINERDDAAFTQSEMAFIINRYKLSSDEAMSIFFSSLVAS